VYNTLGYGFLEKVYHNALAHELAKRGHIVTPNMAIEVYYDSVIVGEYYADLVVDGSVILELKAVETSPSSTRRNYSTTSKRPRLMWD
jgi:GxxExxY protein